MELRAQSNKSEKIAQAVARSPPGKFDTGVTAQEWIARRIRTRRAANYKVCTTCFSLELFYDSHFACSGCRGMERNDGD